MPLAGRALLALLIAAAWAVVATPVTAARADGTICVALVVDFADLGGGVSTTCARVPAGSTGADVLTRAHHVTFDPRYGEDFVCAIDGKPAGGCSSVDGTHDWVYYHRAPGARSWTFSNEGAGTYQPRNASTEGWVYDDGASTAPHPRDVPYGEICPRASASPQPSPTTSATSRAGAAPTSAPVAGAGAPTTQPAETRPPAKPRHRQRATARAVPPRPATARASMTTRAPTSAQAPSSRPVAAASRASGGGATTGLVAGVAALVLLGGGAWWRARRSRMST